MSMWSSIADQIAAETGRPFSVRRERSVGGGCINSAVVLEGREGQFFVKLNPSAGAEMFAAELAGLREIIDSHTVRAPTPICCGSTHGYAYLVLEHIAHGRPNEHCMEQFGQGLARMHAVCGEYYGWSRDNTIGSTPQVNTASKNWVEFWRTQRLQFQFSLAADKGYGGGLQRKGEALLADLDAFFQNYTPTPALLHGDLWSGNYMIDENGGAVIFDPAVYYGDREADLAMTELFGGFPARFYHAYRDAYPLDLGYPMRKTLYNLYHVLNHLNLFGGGYRRQAEDMIDTLLASIR
jgi:protein-ribulosamine 3-kinase